MSRMNDNKAFGSSNVDALRLMSIFKLGLCQKKENGSASSFFIVREVKDKFDLG